MACLDLGALAGPVLVFGGPYSNLAATEAIKAVAEELGIPPARVICSGDLVAYCAEPQATVDLVRDWKIPVVMGNCEESLANGAFDCGCGFEAGSACDLLSAGWYRYALARVDDDSRRWMAGLPRRIDFSLQGRRFAVIHGGVNRINRFLFPSAAVGTLEAERVRAGSEVVIGGHSGIPFGAGLPGGYWLNAGVVGMPANDGTADGWYLLLEPRGGAIRCRWRRLVYDAGVTARRMVEAGLDGGYAGAVLSGVWPSQEVLPPAERGRVGRPLALPELVI